MVKNDKRKKKHWYKQYIGECPVCGRTAGWKERVYGKKPKDTTKVYIHLTDFDSYDHCM